MTATDPGDPPVPDARYIAPWDRKKCLEVRNPGDDEPTVWVPLDLFMDVQRERDEFRRAVAMIGAWRVSGMESIATLDRLLASVGFDMEANRATLGVIRWAQENRTAPTGDDA